MIRKTLFGIAALLLWPAAAGDNGAQSSHSFVDHPRIFLTRAKKAELLSKKSTNHPDFVALKAHADQVLSNNSSFDDSTALASTLNAAATSFIVVDGSVFPQSNVFVRIDIELIHCAARSGNILSGCRRGAEWPGLGRRTAPAPHTSGVDVWRHEAPSGVWTASPSILSMLVQLGDASYLKAARGALSLLTTHISTYIDAASPIYYYWHQDYMRWYGPHIAIAYDWLYQEGLTPHEKALYAERLRLFAAAHLTPGICNTNCSIETWAVDNVKRLTAVQTAVVSNAAAGEIYTSLMCAAASYGDNPQAANQWDKGMQKVKDWMLTGIVNGPGTGGPLPEGMQYAGESYVFIASTMLLIESATGRADYRDELTTWLTDVVKFLFYNTLPGSRSSNSSTTVGSMRAGTTTMTVNSGEGWTEGMNFRTFSGFESTIVRISGTTFTTRDPAPANFTNSHLIHIARFITWGDGMQVRGDRFADQWIQDEFATTGYIAIDTLRAANPLLAGYVRHWLDAVVKTGNLDEQRFRKFLHDDTSVKPVNHTTLPLLWGSTNPNSTGMLIGRDSWSDMGTLVQFLVGGEAFSHVHSHYNSYQIRRGGVWLSNEIYGYGVDPYPGPWATPGCNVYCRLGEGIAMGARYHNTILMNNHGGNNPYILSTEQAGLATIARADVNNADGYLYARGDASGIYQSPAWGAAGYPNDSAQTYIRDFLYIPAADIAVFGDRVGYSAATRSPTTWIARFTGRPVVNGQRIVSQYAGQKIVQDIVVPATATFTEIDEFKEYPTLDDYLTRPYHRVETVSGAITSAEWSLQVIQLGDAVFIPARVSNLTTSNVNVAQIGTDYVVGVVKGETPNFDIAYHYVGNPVHYLMGFEPNTPYDVVTRDGTVIIRPARGSGDVRSNHAGLLILNGGSRPILRAAPPAPSGVNVIR